MTMRKMWLRHVAVRANLTSTHELHTHQSFPDADISLSDAIVNSYIYSKPNQHT